MLKFFWQYSLLIQTTIRFVCFYHSYLQQPQIFKSRAATDNKPDAAIQGWSTSTQYSFSSKTRVPILVYSKPLVLG